MKKVISKIRNALENDDYGDNVGYAISLFDILEEAVDEGVQFYDSESDLEEARITLIGKWVRRTDSNKWVSLSIEDFNDDGEVSFPFDASDIRRENQTELSEGDYVLVKDFRSHKTEDIKWVAGMNRYVGSIARVSKAWDKYIELEGCGQNFDGGEYMFQFHRMWVDRIELAKMQGYLGEK